MKLSLHPFPSQEGPQWSFYSATPHAKMRVYHFLNTTVLITGV